MSVQKKKGLWVFPLVIIMMVYGAFVFHGQSQDIYAINLKLKQIQQKITNEEQLKQQLLEEKEEIKSDDCIEKLAREKLGMVRDGERVFVDTNK